MQESSSSDTVLAKVRVLKGTHKNCVGELLNKTNGADMEVNSWEEVLSFPPGRAKPYRDVHIRVASDKVIVVPKSSVEVLDWFGCNAKNEDKLQLENDSVNRVLQESSQSKSQRKNKQSSENKSKSSSSKIKEDNKENNIIENGANKTQQDTKKNTKKTSESKYSSLSTEELQELCEKRKIKFTKSYKDATLIALLCDYNERKAASRRKSKLKKKINEWLSSDSLLSELDKHVRENPQDVELVLTQVVTSRSDAGLKCLLQAAPLNLFTSSSSKNELASLVWKHGSTSQMEIFHNFTALLPSVSHWEYADSDDEAASSSTDIVSVMKSAASEHNIELFQFLLKKSELSFGKNVPTEVSVAIARSSKNCLIALVNASKEPKQSKIEAATACFIKDLQSARYYREANSSLWLELGAHACVKDSKGYSALYHAQRLGDHSLIEFMLEQGISIDSTVDPDSNTLLHHAVIDGMKAESLLEEFSPNVNIKNRDGDTPLHRLCSGSELDCRILEKILDAGADPNVRNNMGRTPAHCLVYGKPCDYKKALVLLLKAGADFHIMDLAGKSVLDVVDLGEEFLIKHNFKKPTKAKTNLDVDLKEEIGGMWSMRIETDWDGLRWGVIHVKRKSSKHDWNIRFDFGYTCKVKQRHIKETYTGASRMKFRFVGCDAEGERERDIGTGWLEMVQKSPQKVLVGKLHSTYGTFGFVATPATGEWCEVTLRDEQKKYVNVKTAKEIDSRPKGFKDHKEISGWSPSDYCSEDEASSDDYDSERDTSEEELAMAVRAGRWRRW